MHASDAALHTHSPIENRVGGAGVLGTPIDPGGIDQRDREKLSNPKKQQQSPADVYNSPDIVRRTN